MVNFCYVNWSGNWNEMIANGIGKKTELNRKNCNELERELSMNGIDPGPAHG